MENMNQNSERDWVKRMKEYKYPTSGDRKQQSWKKLRERLDNSRKKKSIPWARIAAVLITLLVATVLIFVKSRQHNATDLSKDISHSQEIKKRNDSTTDVVRDAATLTKEASGPPPVPRTSLTAAKMDTTQLIKNGEAITFTDSGVLKEPDSAITQAFTVHEPEALPVLHINDFQDKEPQPKNVTLRNMSVKKLIHLFSTDMTIEQKSQKQRKLPQQPDSITDTQN